MSVGVVVVGVNHRSASVELRERLAVASDAIEEAVRGVRALDGVREAVLVATCNRVEVYAAGDDDDRVARAAQAFFASRGADDAQRYEHRGGDAVRHAFRVCASLDSMVVGEPQILGQVKEAYSVAKAAGCVGASLSRLMSHAFLAAKRVRTETGIASGQVSVASVAADLARGIFGDLKGRRVLVVGAGKMALGAARSLVRHGAQLAVANRSFARAEALAKEQGGTAHPFSDLTMLLQHCDVVVCSTGAQGYVLSRDLVQSAMRARRGRSLFIIDITVPRNVDPRVGDLDSVYLYDLDDLEQIVAEGGRTRSEARQAAEDIVSEEVVGFVRAEREKVGAGPTIAAIRQRYRAAAQAELERSFAQRLKHLKEDERKAVEAMIEAYTNKVLHAPTMALRAAGSSGDDALLSAAQTIFGLAEGGS
ncbi:MAG: glutamyl-tRNA reductase [Polyangiales bacterium]